MSEIGFSAMLNAARLRSPGSKENLVPVNTGSQSDKNQAMWDHLADVINGWIQANEQFTQLPEETRRRCASSGSRGAGDAEPGARRRHGRDRPHRAALLRLPRDLRSVHGKSDDFTLDKEFFVLFSPETPPEIMQAIDTAMEEIYAEGEIQQRQLESFFIPNYRPMEEAQAHLQEKRTTTPRSSRNCSPSNAGPSHDRPDRLRGRAFVTAGQGGAHRWTA